MVQASARKHALAQEKWRERLVLARRLLDCEKLFHSALIGCAHQTGVGEVAFLLLGLLCKNVALVGVFSLDFSCSGKGEPLFGTGISLNLWYLG